MTRAWPKPRPSCVLDRPRSLPVSLPGVAVLGLVLLVPLFAGVPLLAGFLTSRLLLLLLVAGALFLMLRTRILVTLIMLRT
jgi:hypothetical protein